MADAGLTNGAFYAHFASKEDLVATAVADQLRNQRESLARRWRPAAPDVEQIVRAYLSPEHRDNPDDGCPSAALLDEIGRCTDADQAGLHRRRARHSSTTSPPAWRRTIRPRHAPRRSASTP